MKILRKLYYKLFGLKSYLSLISIVYIKLVKNGFFKNKYPELFYLSRLVKAGDVCIDIGANLGYYSTFLSRVVGENGKIYAVEPVPLFLEILHKNIKKMKAENVEILPYALGEKEEKVRMGMPEHNGVIHHGMTKIADSSNDNFVEYFEAEMKIPNQLFADIEKINFVKCDVEGYEHYVFSNMQEVLKKHKPIVQSELSGKENRIAVYKLFKDLEYICYQLNDGNLVEKTEQTLFEKESDFYFLPKKD